MLKEKFEKWSVDPISYSILLTLSMHVTNLGYQEDRPSCFMELLNGNMKELNRTLKKLDNAAAILENLNKHPPDPSNSEAKFIKKQEEKAQKRQ